MENGNGLVAQSAERLATGTLKPVIDRVFAFDDMVDLHRYLEQSDQFGKIVVAL